MSPDRRRSRLAWIGLALLATSFALDFHFDTRNRDVFSWMDPYQYYEFALGMLEGRESFDHFEIPSIFPFFVLPLLAVEPSIPAALWVNGAALLLLLGSVHGLCRELAVRTPSVWVASMLLSSPLLLGLSRTLYVEFTLTALTSAVFLCWLRLLRAPGPGPAAAFAGLLGLAFLTKITFPLFVIAPVGAAVLAAIADGRDRQAALFAAAGLLPLVLAVALQVGVFAPSLGYYLNLVSTTLPFMYLMGPPEPWSGSSAGFYLGEVGRSFLFLLTPLFGVAVMRLLRGIRSRSIPTPHVALWLWLLGPLILLIAHPLKEARHVAPCVVPAVLLLVLGIESLPQRRLRAGLLVGGVALAWVQYAAVTLGALESPYFMDRSLHAAEIRERLAEADALGPHRGTRPALRELHQRYGRNVAISGFPPNESLALSWQAFPGVVFDLDILDDRERFFGNEAFERFEDLFFLAAVNAYNRRCGWRWYHPTLSREQVIRNADFLIVNDAGTGTSPGRFPEHAVLSTISRESGSIRILGPSGPTTPYRTLYARRFLERNPALSDDETRVVARELLVAAVLGGEAPAARALLREFPTLQGGGETRNIYWIGGYPSLLGLADQQLASLSLGKGVQ